ncbi:zinc finger HIT domain-containing protein 3 isoform X2 [Phalaenopsis equestris]|nr:zinc finger HIT domain-containing protein 3 isoform X2 [Phalaenopsis equestris]
MALRQCQVCKEAQYKYKCPSCLLLYCSSACFKRHKGNPCQKSLTPQEETISMVLPERTFEVDETNWILGSDQLQLIAQSKGIRDALNDVELQKLVYKIDSCSNPEEELDKAMEREGFPQFTEMILSSVSPKIKPSR